MGKNGSLYGKIAEFVRLNFWENKMAVGRRLGRRICLALCPDEMSS
jgi:hypothetical protein